MLKAAEMLSAQITLEGFVLTIKCLPTQPQMVTGGHGISGPSFVDIAAYREWLYQNFQANAVDMETAAVAQVAYMNRLPFLGFRSLSDLAGGSAGSYNILVVGNLTAHNAAVVVIAFLETWSGLEAFPAAQ